MKWLLSSDIDSKSLLVTFTVVTFVSALISLIVSHIFLQCLPATVLFILFFALNLTFYRFNNLDKVDFSLKSGTIDLENNDNLQNNKQNDR